MAKYSSYKKLKKKKYNKTAVAKLKEDISKILSNNCDDINRYRISDVFKLLKLKKLIIKKSPRLKCITKHIGEYYFFTGYKNYRFNQIKMSKKEMKKMLTEILRDSSEDIIPYMVKELMRLFKSRKLIR